MNKNFNDLTDDEFRLQVVQFVHERCPPELRNLTRLPTPQERDKWASVAAEAGWLAPGWPQEYGGMGLTPSKHLIYLEEFEINGAPDITTQGIMNVGPVLIRFGTQEQKDRYLPRILSGEDQWCQGFSEPNAGSDLASLRTEARLEGDEFIINGQKIWTSRGFDANKMFALVRTDKTVRKQAGISFVMFDMDQPGITVRPIKTIAGDAEFCEVFLDDVRAQARDLVGGLNEGWRIANGLLGFERLWAGSSHQSKTALVRLERIAKQFDLMSDPVFRDRYIQLQLDVDDLASTYARSTELLRTTGVVGLEASTLKIWATELCQRIQELTLESVASNGYVSEPLRLSDGEINIMHSFLDGRAPTIYGGSVEIHRNILAKRVLQLPDWPPNN